MVDQDLFVPLFGSEYIVTRNENCTVWSRGIVVTDSGPYQVNEFLLKGCSLDESAEMATKLNGFFSFAVYQNGEVAAVADRVRSFPLFYAIENGILYLGDNPYRIQKKIHGRQMDPFAMAELYLTGYVTGEYTFDPRIKQVPAGEVLLAQIQTDGNWSFRRKVHYRFCHHDEFALSYEHLLRQSQMEMDGAVERLMQVAAGSLIAIPLSAGYDSRFILLTLKRLKYPNLLAFSYGAPGNQEATISKYVAESLGVPWSFVAYTPELWREWLDSDEFSQYQIEGEKMVSVPHIQDWPAVWMLKKSGALPDETLFAPGHSGDFLGGKQIRTELLKKNGWNEKSVLREICARHCIHASWKVVFRELGLDVRAKATLLERSAEHLKGWNVNDFSGANNAFDSEFWQEKLSKFIVNSMRVYEFWGYRWWLPFYDKELVAFWERVPIEWRTGKILYDNTVEALQNAMGLAVCKGGKANLLQKIRKWASSPLVDWLAWRLHGRKYLLDNYVLGIQKSFPRDDFFKFIKDKGHINGYLASMQRKRYSGM